MVTGESVPAEKAMGDAVIGATVNKTGHFTCIAEKVGSDTMLSQILQLVEETQMTQAPIQRLADKISTIFVPIVIMLAVAAFVFWLFLVPLPQAIYIAITILIIACPCALGLATPVAIMVGTGAAAKKGILVKNAEAFDIAQKAKILVFDKTGTLTKGKPEVVRFYRTKTALKEDVILGLAQGIEEKSEHPLSEAIVSFAHAHKPAKVEKSEHFKVLAGQGVEGSSGKYEIVMGNMRLIEERKIRLPQDLKDELPAIYRSGYSIVYMAINGKVQALFALADIIKENVAATMIELHRGGRQIVMLTGDNKRTADVIAKQLHIDKTIAEVLPTDKANKIKNLQEGGAKVIMIGDGINDATALEQADVGIAVGTGADISIESADIVLLNGSIEKVQDALDLSGRTMAVIRQNLFWAFAYNAIAIPIAAGILYPTHGILLSPTIASAAMALSSITVVLNSLRLR